MARVCLEAGIRYLLNNQVYLIRQLLPEDKLLIENQTFGGQVTINHSDLDTEWAKGGLRFELSGPNTRSELPPTSDKTAPKNKRTTSNDLVTAYTFADFQQLPERYQKEAWRRYQLLMPLLKPPGPDDPPVSLTEYAKSLLPPPQSANPANDGPDSSAPVCVKTHRTRSPIGQATSRASLQRWLTGFRQSGWDIRSLVPAAFLQGGKGQTRLGHELETIVSTVLAECASKPAYRTTQDVYLLIVQKVAELNRTRLPDQQLKLPGQATIARRIKSGGWANATILNRRATRSERVAQRGVFAGPKPTRILERVEMDHTLLDLFVVDETDRLPIGRPTLTLALDAYSAFPLGVYVGFEPPSYRSVMNCLWHAILPKSGVKEQYDTQNGWPAYGLPETLVVDHGREFSGRDLKEACAQLGIALELTPPRSPWFKGKVERYFRTTNTGLIHTLPGTTFSNLIERGDYDPAKHACISLTAFWKILHLFLLDFYAQDWHSRLDDTPARRWAASLAAGFHPSLPHSADELRILLMRGEERTIQRQGIEFETLLYQSPELAQLYTRLLPTNRTVRVKYDPGNLSVVYVLNPTSTFTSTQDHSESQGSCESGNWLRVPALDQNYTSNLSLWKHRLISQG